MYVNALMFYQDCLISAKVLTPAVVIGVLLLVVIRAQDLLVLLWEGRVRLTRLRAASTTMRL